MKSFMLLLSIVVVGVVLYLSEPCQGTSSPILLVPGIMGSRLEVRDDKPWSLCSTRHMYWKIWIKPMRIILFNLCAKRELKLKYDASTNSYHNNSQVRIHVPGFGKTNGVEYLNTGWIDFIPYFHDMVEYFVDRGYARGKSIRAAPYDWRLAADELDKRGYFNQVKKLVEDMYRQNNKQKVTIVSHSLGGPIILYFLTSFAGVNQSWKDKYVNAFVPLNGAWSGGVSTLPEVISGTERTPQFLKFAEELVSNFLVPIARTLESIPWIYPKAAIYGNDILISTPSRHYTANDYKQLFSDIGYTNGYKMFQGVQKINQGYPSPNVHTYCYYGVNVKTPETYTYHKDFKRDNSIGMRPSIKYGNGDGSVNLVSAEICHKWKIMPSSLYSFTYRKYNKVNHDGILKNTRVLADIAAIARAPPPTSHISL